MFFHVMAIHTEYTSFFHWKKSIKQPYHSSGNHTILIECDRVDDIETSFHFLPILFCSCIKSVVVEINHRQIYGNNLFDFEHQKAACLLWINKNLWFFYDCGMSVSCSTWMWLWVVSSSFHFFCYNNQYTSRADWIEK